MQITIDSDKLMRVLIDARYKILTSLRPIAPARHAHDLVVQALIDLMPCSELETITMLKGLLLTRTNPDEG